MLLSMLRDDQRQTGTDNPSRNNAAVRNAALCILNGNGAHFCFLKFCYSLRKTFSSGG